MNSMTYILSIVVCFFKQKTAYEMRISDWSSDVCSSDLSLGQLDHSAKQTFQNMASRFFFEWITLGSYLSRAPASARLLFLLHCTHRYNPPVCKIGRAHV